MIIKEIIEIDGRMFQRSYSDKNVMITRDGRYFAEACDPEGHYDREYEETEIIIEEN